MKKFSVLIALIGLTLFTLPVMAAYTAEVHIANTGSALAKLPVKVSGDFDYMATHGYMESDGEDLDIMSCPRMVADNAVYFVVDLSANLSQSYPMTTGNADVTNKIISGYGGYVTIPYNANWSPKDATTSWQLDYTGYIYTQSGTGEIAECGDPLIDVFGANTIRVRIANVYDQYLTATGITDGSHHIRWTWELPNISKLYVDDMVTPKDTDTVNVWTGSDIKLLQTSAAIYITSFKVSQDGVEKIWYEPTTIIAGTVLPDRKGNKNGVFTFGSNPGTVTATIENLKSDNIVIPSLGNDPDNPNNFPVIGDPANEWDTDADTYAGTGNVFYGFFKGWMDLVNTAGTAGGYDPLPMIFIWTPICIALSLAATYFIFKYSKNLLFACFGGLVIGGAFVGMGLLPFWVIALPAIADILLIFSERSGVG